MDGQCKLLSDDIARAVIEQDSVAIHKLLAPWYQKQMSVSAIEALIGSPDQTLPQAREWEVDEQTAKLDDLKKPGASGLPSSSIPEEITAENYRGWDPPATQAGSRQSKENSGFDVWFAPVELEGLYCVGYLEAGRAG